MLGYKEGRTLSEWLFNEKRVFSKEEIFQIGCQVFEILIYLHRRNVVHGDISVANVIYDGENISLLDFGLARFADRRNIRFSLDYARAADVLLYLLYSGYSGNGKKPWYEELPLTETQKEFLGNLMKPEAVYERTECVLDDFCKYFGPDRRCSVAREISKLHEEHRRGTLEEVAAWYREHEPKGEIVVIVGGKPDSRHSQKDMDGSSEFAREDN